jgi:hypothetical protein
MTVDSKTVNDNYMPEATLETMKLSFIMSGIRGMDFIPEHIVIREGDDKVTSTAMGAIIKPCEQHPDGGIVLYMDAILHYSTFIGKDFIHIAAKIMFAQVHNLMSYKEKGKFDFHKAEIFATRACRKLMKRKFFTWMPPVFYIDAKDEKMRYNLLLRQEWIKNWTGKELEEVAKEMGNE